MLDMTQLLVVIKHLFKDKNYGDTLKEYITKHNPQTTSDIEILERQWLYRQNRYTGGKW